MGSILIKNGFVLTMDKKNTMIPHGVVEIKDAHISHVGEGPSKSVPEESAKIIDAEGKVVMPGLINAHTHLCMTFARTVCYDLTLTDWINKVQYPLMDEMGEHGYYLAEMIGCMENLKNGNTTVVENLVSSNKDGVTADGASLKAYKETGLRGVLVRSYADQNYYPNAIETREEILSRCRELVQECGKSGADKLEVRMGPVLPWSSSQDMFRETLRLAEELDIGLHMHASENADWNVRGEEVHGLPTNIAIFKEFGLLGPKTTIAAMRVISDEDIRDLAEAGSGLIHDPPAVLNRGTGLPPISKALASGVQVGLGSNALGQDMFETMKTAGWVARTLDGRPDALPVNLALEMGTIRNAQILGLDTHVGSLEIGKKADIITVNLNTPHHAPCLNVISALVNCTSGGDVADVIVDGKLVIKDGNILDLDEQSIIGEAYDRALAFAKKARLDDRLHALLGGTS